MQRSLTIGSITALATSFACCTRTGRNGAAPRRSRSCYESRGESGQSKPSPNGDAPADYARAVFVLIGTLQAVDRGSEADPARTDRPAAGRRRARRAGEQVRLGKVLHDSAADQRFAQAARDFAKQAIAAAGRIARAPERIEGDHQSARYAMTTDSASRPMRELRSAGTAGVEAADDGTRQLEGERPSKQTADDRRWFRWRPSRPRMLVAALRTRASDSIDAAGRRRVGRKLATPIRAGPAGGRGRRRSRRFRAFAGGDVPGNFAN